MLADYLDYKTRLLETLHPEFMHIPLGHRLQFAFLLLVCLSVSSARLFDIYLSLTLCVPVLLLVCLFACPSMSRQTHRQADRQRDTQDSGDRGHPFRVSGLFPSTYHQGAVQQIKTIRKIFVR